ncbi:MAG: 4Fe-4S binding protein [Bilophila wadsworthia]
MPRTLPAAHAPPVQGQETRVRHQRGTLRQLPYLCGHVRLSGLPASGRQGSIDPVQCIGCAVCAQVCPNNAIRPQK